MPNKVLKDSIGIIAPMLRDICNLSITTSSFPDDLKILKVAGVHKAGDKEDPNNYTGCPKKKYTSLKNNCLALRADKGAHYTSVDR